MVVVAAEVVEGDGSGSDGCGGCQMVVVVAAYACANPIQPRLPLFSSAQASHFDAGFADSTVGIINRWFTQHFPRCYAIGLELDAMGGAPGKPQLKFMTQSWLVSLYLDCPVGVPGLQCPSPAAVANFTDAVKRGYITWHSFPHNAELEVSGGDGWGPREGGW
jgi:hypothetical protein